MFSGVRSCRGLMNGCHRTIASRPRYGQLNRRGRGTGRIGYHRPIAHSAPGRPTIRRSRLWNEPRVLSLVASRLRIRRTTGIVPRMG